jgi:tetratricopeptide (TPR) repeat protein
MKKKMVVLLAIIPLLFGTLAAQNECDEAYVKAMTSQSPAQKAQALKDFLARCTGKGSQYENFANANLSLLNYPGKTAAEAVSYGEKALALGGLDDLTKCQLLIQLSALYSQSGQNLEKARSYANQVTEVARANKVKQEEAANSAQWNQFIGAGYFALGQAQEKSKNFKDAVDSYANSYSILKNPQILASIKKMGKTLYEAKAYDDAEKAFKAAYAATKNNDLGVLYAQSLYRNDKDAEALALFKEIYGKEKSGELAYNIGIILAKQAKANPAVATEAIRYLLEASFTYPAQSQQAMKLAENLFFLNNKDLKYNETVTEIQAKSKKIEELTGTYNTKFGNKDEEDLTDSEKTEMKALLANIDTEKKALEKLQSEQNMAIAKFSKLLEDTKVRLGIR